MRVYFILLYFSLATEQLSGKDRRKYVEQKVVELGAKVSYLL